MNKAVRLIAATGLLGVAYFSAGQTDISLSLWIATALLFAITVLLEDLWQFVAVLLALPLMFLLYNSGSRDALTLVVFSLISVLSSIKIAVGLWVIAGVLFVLEGLFFTWHLGTLPFLLLGLGSSFNKELKPQFLPARALQQEMMLPLDQKENLQLKKEVAFLRAHLDQRRVTTVNNDFERVGKEIGEVTSKLSLLLFEIGSLLDEGILTEIPAFEDLKAQMVKLRKVLPQTWCQTFFTDSLSAILNRTALDKKVVLHLRLKKMDLTVAEKFVLNEMTKGLLEDNKEYEISLEDGEDGLFYVIRPIDKKQLDERIEKLIAGIDGTVIFGDGNAYLIWRKENYENTLNSLT
ncbi:MAG: hypothetical protein PHD88_00665 [Firmicutes bacterium]|nr:hypothetical protein [Bacillota bacterium]MDD4263551.1 hypothetical protein [Bacillota bacterium]MDD4692906.1 hypothetical protein [Bacillota bacterium]